MSFILGSKSRKIAQRGALDELRFGLWPTSRGQLRGPSEVMCQLTTSCESTRRSRVPRVFESTVAYIHYYYLRRTNNADNSGRKTRGVGLILLVHSSPPGLTHALIPLPSWHQVRQPRVERPARHEVRRCPRAAGLEAEPSKHLAVVEAVDARDEAGRRASLLTAQREQVGSAVLAAHAAQPLAGVGLARREQRAQLAW